MAGWTWLRRAASVAGVAFVAACTVNDASDDDAAQQSTQPTAQTAPAPPSAPAPADTAAGLRFLVDISDRMLYVIKGQDTMRRDPVAVGMKEHPTPTGEWKLHRVDWNPDWTPPPGEDWTEDKEKQPPGAALNPMGRARLVFQMPYTIHGTKDRESLGTAESHGSIRVANETVVALGRLIMEEGGANKPASFFDEVAANRKEMRQVDIPNPIPIRIQE
jgi:lipoprotein-anchoring transpeptidase ErfK/SrfK